MLLVPWNQWRKTVCRRPLGNPVEVPRGVSSAKNMGPDGSECAAQTTISLPRALEPEPRAYSIDSSVERSSEFSLVGISRTWLELKTLGICGAGLICGAYGSIPLSPLRRCSYHHYVPSLPYHLTNWICGRRPVQTPTASRPVRCAGATCTSAGMRAILEATGSLDAVLLHGRNATHSFVPKLAKVGVIAFTIAPGCPPTVDLHVDQTYTMIAAAP